MLDQEDKASLPDLEIHKPKVIRMPAKKPTKKAKIIFNYTSSDHFVTEHVNEINKAYNATCYTSAYILSRKVVENLIIGILRAQFPDTSLANKQLYYDIGRKRYLDFSVILQNLFDKRDEFPTGKKKAIERLYVLTKDFKDEANDRTHSLYHIVTKPKEIDELDLPTILALIADIEKTLGIRQE